MKKLVLLCLLLVSSYVSYSQSDRELHQQYPSLKDTTDLLIQGSIIGTYTDTGGVYSAEIYSDMTNTISFGSLYTWICSIETLESRKDDDMFEIIQVNSYGDTIFTEHRSEVASSSVTEYFVEARPETNDITHIFVFEGVKRIIAYSEGFKNVFNLRYTEFPWSRPGEVVLQTMFCDFRLVVDADQGHIFCDDLVWNVYNVEYYGDKK